jgi:DNA invertase Pin-like site-specific DNA recombinase
MSASPVAYSFIRFSHPSQLEGDSLRRQTEDARAWCERNKVRLDTNLTLHDLGTSAFRGKHRQNPDVHALAAFLQLIERGRVPKGSYLIIENLDRLSREEERTGLRLWMDILDAGVNIVQLKPETIFRHEKSDMVDIIRALIELSRGHSESAMKSHRCGRAWAQKKKRAREKGEVMTPRIPAWVEEKDGSLVLIPDRAAVVKRIYHLAAAGYGHGLIVRTLTREKVPGFGPSGKWIRSYISKILTDRRALGECQPKGLGGKKDGDPIPNYFPPVVTEAEFLAARAGAAERKGKNRRGRVGEKVNVFAGLLKNARDGGSYLAVTQRYRKLVNASAVDGPDKAYSFPFEPFELGILSLLAEVDPREVLGKDDGPDEVLTLSGQLAQLDESIALIVKEMDEHGESPTLFRRLREKEERRADVTARLAAARQKAAHPLSESWGEAKSLLSVLDKAPDPIDARIRLRSALRRVVEAIWLLVVRRDQDRVCFVQVFFTGGREARCYLLVHRPRSGNGKKWRPGHLWAKSYLDPLSPPEEGPNYDLRDRDDETIWHLEKMFEALDPTLGDQGVWDLSVDLE